MFHSNLPTGVTVGMLPGNSKADAAWEKACEWARADFFSEFGREPTDAEVEERAELHMNY